MNFNYRNFPIVLVSILLSLWIGGCIDLPTNLKVPQWDVDLNVPLVNRSYTLNDIIKEQKYISIQGTSSADSIYVLQSDTYSQSADVSNFIQLNATSSSTGNIIPVVNSVSATIYLPIPKGAILDNAIFKSGFLSLYAANPNPEVVDILIAFPGIIQNGSELKISMTVPASGQDSVQTPLAGCTYLLPANQTTQNQGYIQLVISGSSISLPLGSFVTMSIYSSNFSFSSATGYLPEQSLGVKSQQFSLNLGDAQNYGNKASLKYAELDMDVKYYSPASNPFGILVDSLNIIGVRNDGSQLALKDSTGSSNITFTINGTKHLSFTQDNSNITSFISFLPSTILLSADYIMNPSNSTGTVTNQDSVVFSTNFSTSSILALQKTLITDTTSINITNQDSLKIQDARSAYINVNVQNGIPLNAWLTINFVDGGYNHLFSDSLSFLAANINTATGEVTSAFTTNNVIQLDSAQAAKLAGAHYAIVSINVQTNDASSSPAQYVAIRPNDSIQVTVYGGVNYHVNTNDLK